MSQLVSTAAGNSSYTTYDTKIPELNQAADIVEALRLYHYGNDNFTSGGAPNAVSIYNHLKTLQDNINALQQTLQDNINTNGFFLLGV